MCFWKVTSSRRCVQWPLRAKTVQSYNIALGSLKPVVFPSLLKEMTSLYGHRKPRDPDQPGLGMCIHEVSVFRTSKVHVGYRIDYVIIVIANVKKRNKAPDSFYYHKITFNIFNLISTGQVNVPWLILLSVNPEQDFRNLDKRRNENVVTIYECCHSLKCVRSVNMPKTLCIAFLFRFLLP